MNTNILKQASRNTFECIYIDFGLDAKDFEMLKNRHEDNFYGLTFNAAKKKIIKDVFTDKKQLSQYLKDNKNYFAFSLQDGLGAEYLNESIGLIIFIEKLIDKM